jgi:hypothetical protein
LGLLSALRPVGPDPQRFGPRILLEVVIANIEPLQTARANIFSRVEKMFSDAHSPIGSDAGAGEELLSPQFRHEAVGRDRLARASALARRWHNAVRRL